jgi:transcriptional antiterminator Rof (Rho-off)
MNDHGPVSCTILDHLELLAMRRAPCRIHYRDCESTDAVAEGVITDFQVINGAEYLVLENSPLRIRLDTIIGIQEAHRPKNQKEKIQ